MKTINLEIGSPEWLAHRATPGLRNASDASAMMGNSPYVSRADLIKRIATGITPEVDARTQSLFDEGHRIEALARPLAEAFIGDDLYPTLGVSDEHPHLSATFDGLTLSGSIAWECKSWNAGKAANVREGRVPAADLWQCIQQLVVSGAEKLLYTVSDGTPERTLHCWLTLRDDEPASLLAGWLQFDEDLAAYVPETPKAVVLAAPVESLPAVSVRMDGKIAVIDNLDVFGERLRAFVEKIDKEPSTDQAFADCEEAVKVLKRAEEALEAAEANALAQIDPVEQMRRTVADLNGLARTTRLLVEKVVKQRKEQLRTQVAAEARTAYCTHLSQINANLPVPVLEATGFVPDVAAATKGKRSLDNLRADVSQVVANYKIAACAEAERHRANLEALASYGRAELFGDRDTLVRTKQPDDLGNLIRSRIAEADAQAQARLDAERALIRQEEEQRAQREVEKLAEQGRERIRKEEQAKAQAEQHVYTRDEFEADSKGQTGQDLANASRAANESQAGTGPAPTTAPAAVAVNTTEQAPVAAVRLGATLKLGDINARIAPLTISGDGLAALGFKPVAMDKASKLYAESDFGNICRAMGRVLKAAMEVGAMKEAARAPSNWRNSAAARRPSSPAP